MDALFLLVALNAEFPIPAEKQYAHSLTLDKLERPVIGIWAADQCHTFTLDDADINRPNCRLIDEMKQAIEKRLKEA